MFRLRKQYLRFLFNATNSISGIYITTGNEGWAISTMVTVFSKLYPQEPYRYGNWYAAVTLSNSTGAFTVNNNIVRVLPMLAGTGGILFGSSNGSTWPLIFWRGQRSFWLPTHGDVIVLGIHNPETPAGHLLLRNSAIYWYRICRNHGRFVLTRGKGHLETRWVAWMDHLLLAIASTSSNCQYRSLQ